MQKHDKSPEAFKGFELWFNTLRMRLKMYGKLAIFSAIPGVIAAALYLRYTIASVLDSPSMDRGWQLLSYAISHIQINYGWQVAEVMISGLGQAARPHLVMAGFIFFIAAAPAYWLLLKFFAGRAGSAESDQHIRGAILSTTAEVRRALAKNGMSGDIPLGDVTLPSSYETRHVFIAGASGSGKTQAISHALDRLRERGGKAIVYDNKTDFTSMFFRPELGDYIFSPIDTRCCGWNLFNDLLTLPDIEAMSASLIPPPTGSQDPFWSNTARQVMEGIVHALYVRNERNNAGFFNLISSPDATIAETLKITKGAEFGARLVDDREGKTSKSILQTLTSNAQGFRHMSKVDGDFSLDRWINDGKPGFLFVPAPPASEESVKPAISLFIDLLARKVLSLPDNPDRRIFFFLDEFGNLQKLPAVISLLTLSRSKGGSVWLGIQDLGRIDSVYGRSERQTIINNCATTLVFGMSDPETARFFSDQLGEAEIIETTESHSMGPADSRDGLSLSRRVTTKKIVLPAEIQNLEGLTGYLRMMGGYNPCRIKIQYKTRPVIAQGILMREDLRLENFHAQQISTNTHSIDVPPSPEPEQDDGHW